MALSRLELNSGHGDQTVTRVRFVLHGTGLASGEELLRSGLDFVEGKAVVSTSLSQAHVYARDSAAAGTQVAGSPAAGGEDSGVITVIAVPSDFHLGYSAFTTAFIDRSLKMVLGAPLRFADARKQLAFYAGEDTESARIRIEREVMGGKALDSQPELNIGARYMIGGFRLGSALKNVITALDVSARAFEPIDFTSAESSLAALFTVREPAEAVLVPSMVKDLVVGTVESVVLSRIRMMRWEGLAMLGYTFREGRKDVMVVKPKDVDEQRRRIDECGRLLASSSIFAGELAWLKTYVGGQLELMRVELDGAELEAA